MNIIDTAVSNYRNMLNHIQGTKELALILSLVDPGFTQKQRELLDGCIKLYSGMIIRRVQVAKGVTLGQIVEKMNCRLNTQFGEFDQYKDEGFEGDEVFYIAFFKPERYTNYEMHPVSHLDEQRIVRYLSPARPIHVVAANLAYPELVTKGTNFTYWKNSYGFACHVSCGLDNDGKKVTTLQRNASSCFPIDWYCAGIFTQTDIISENTDIR